LALLLCRNAAKGAPRAELDKLRDVQDRFAALDTLIFAVTGDLPDANRALRADRKLPFPVLSDAPGRLLAHFGVTEANSVVLAVADSNLRLQALIRPGAARLAVAALNLCRRLHEASAPAQLRAAAPVLLLPDLFS